MTKAGKIKLRGFQSFEIQKKPRPDSRWRDEREKGRCSQRCTWNLYVGHVTLKWSWRLCEIWRNLSTGPLLPRAGPAKKYFSSSNNLILFCVRVIWRSEQLRMCWLPQMWWCAPSVHRSSCVGLGRGSCAPPIHHHHQNHQNNHHHYFIYCQILSGLGVQPCHTEDHPPPLSISFWQGK